MGKWRRRDRFAGAVGSGRSRCGRRTWRSGRAPCAWGCGGEHGRGGGAGPGEGEGDEGEQEALDRPALAVGLERGAGGGVGDGDEQLAVREALGGEVQERVPARRLSPLIEAQPGAEHARPPAQPEAGEQRQLVAFLGGDVEPKVRLRRNEVLLQADGEGDIVFAQEFHPLATDELPVGQQQPDGGDLEDREVAPDQRDALRGAAVAALCRARSRSAARDAGG